MGGSAPVTATVCTLAADWAPLPPAVAVGSVTPGLGVQAAIGVRNSQTCVSPISRDCRTQPDGMSGNVQE